MNITLAGYILSLLLFYQHVERNIIEEKEGDSFEPTCRIVAY